jgi:DNA-nicking Smr family endonuclease
VKIIHGRGLRSPKEPVLKDRVTRLLAGRHQQRDRTQRLGNATHGLGALYMC